MGWGGWGCAEGVIVDIVVMKGLLSVTLDEVLECPAVPGSQVCGSWNFPRFLWSEGSLTLMYMASLMFLAMPRVFLSTMEKQSGLTGCPVVVV